MYNVRVLAMPHHFEKHDTICVGMWKPDLSLLHSSLVPATKISLKTQHQRKIKTYLFPLKAQTPQFPQLKSVGS